MRKRAIKISIKVNLSDEKWNDLFPRVFLLFQYDVQYLRTMNQCVQYAHAFSILFYAHSVVSLFTKNVQKIRPRHSSITDATIIVSR